MISNKFIVTKNDCLSLQWNKDLILCFITSMICMQLLHPKKYRLLRSHIINLNGTLSSSTQGLDIQSNQRHQYRASKGRSRSRIFKYCNLNPDTSIQWQAWIAKPSQYGQRGTYPSSVMCCTQAPAESETRKQSLHIAMVQATHRLTYEEWGWGLSSGYTKRVEMPLQGWCLPACERGGWVCVWEGQHRKGVGRERYRAKRR